MMKNLNKQIAVLFLITVSAIILGACSDAANDNNPLGSDYNNPKDLAVNTATVDPDAFYTSRHEWVKILNDSVIVVGISDAGQALIGEIGAIRENEVPNPGSRSTKGDTLTTVEPLDGGENFKIINPVEGDFYSYNNQLNLTPNLINIDPYTYGWVYKLIDYTSTDFNDLMDATDYQDYLDSLGL
jgi:glycine cleavage system H protein